jgi:sugar lactone lactonase YvrE
LKRSDAWSPTAFASSGGNLWCGWGRGEPLDGVMIFNPAGNRIGKIDLPARCASIREFARGLDRYPDTAHQFFVTSRN